MTLLQVIATSDVGTRAALREARRVASRLEAERVVLLVPQLHDAGDGNGAAADHEAVVDEYRRMASRAGVPITVRVCACRGLKEAARWLLPHGSAVIIGGRRRWWWPTREQRMADLLARIGYQTYFADCTTMPE